MARLTDRSVRAVSAPQGRAQRYAHLFEDPLRRPTGTVGTMVPGNGKGADVVPVRKGRGDGA